jgi:hypothetical protein
MKMLEIFGPYSQHVLEQLRDQRLARTQLKEHLKKNKNMPKQARLVRLIAAPSKKRKNKK